MKVSTIARSINNWKQNKRAFVGIRVNPDQKAMIITYFQANTVQHGSKGKKYQVFDSLGMVLAL
jgi:hypothetical protein